MYRAVIALAAALLVGCSAPDKDEVFMDVLHDSGVSITLEEANVLAAVVCMAYDDYPDTDIHTATLAVMKQRPTWTPTEAASFIGAAVAAYCPQHLESVR